MEIKFAKRNTRPGEITVNISKAAKTISFSSGFVRSYLKKERPKYVREGWIEKTKQIVIEFVDTMDKSDELLTLTYTKAGNSASCVVRPLLNEFELSLDNIIGKYKAAAIDGPIKLDGTDREIIILSTDKREGKKGSTVSLHEKINNYTTAQE